MRHFAALGIAAVLVACAAQGPHVVQRPSTARVRPVERERIFSRALQVVQQQGWIVAVSDRAAGLLTTQPMNTGVRACGTIACNSRSTLQITIADTGEVTVNLHREFFAPAPATIGWFVPTLERDVRPTEAEQATLLAAIVASPGR